MFWQQGHFLCELYLLVILTGKIIRGKNVDVCKYGTWGTERNCRREIVEVGAAELIRCSFGVPSSVDWGNRISYLLYAASLSVQEFEMSSKRSMDRDKRHGCLMTSSSTYTVTFNDMQCCVWCCVLLHMQMFIKRMITRPCSCTIQCTVSSSHTPVP